MQRADGFFRRLFFYSSGGFNTPDASVGGGRTIFFQLWQEWPLEQVCSCEQL